jgi:mannose-6-phosphate isomerase-like protein (cupin superfamily)
MSDAVNVRPGEELRVGNVEFLAISEDTPRFDASIITMAPRRHGPPVHVHGDEDDAFLVLEGDLTVRILNLHAPAGFDLRPRGEAP